MRLKYKCIQNKWLTRVSSDPDINNEPFEFQATALTHPRWPYSDQEQKYTSEVNKQK